MTPETCKRKGCRKKARNGHPYCTQGCFVVVQELSQAHHVYEALDSSEVTDRYRDAAESLVRVWEEVQQARWEVWNAGIAAGWEPRQIHALMRGQLTVKQQVDCPPTDATGHGSRPTV